VVDEVAEARVRLNLKLICLSFDSECYQSLRLRQRLCLGRSYDVGLEHLRGVRDLWRSSSY
jgi:hypothetical protein